MTFDPGAGDGDTIGEDENGDLEVKLSNIVDGRSIKVINNELHAAAITTVIGDFESNMGSWSTFTAGSGYAGQTDLDPGAEGTNGYAIIGDTSGAAMYRTVDLTGIETLEFYVSGNDDNSQNGGFELRLDGTTVLDETDKSFGSRGADWSKYEFDVSSYNGNTEIRFYTSGPNYDETYIDRVKLVGGIQQLRFDGEGN